MRQAGEFNKTCGARNRENFFQARVGEMSARTFCRDTIGRNVAPATVWRRGAQFARVA